MSFHEPRTFDPESLNFAARAFYECTQAYADMAGRGMDILQDASQPWLFDKFAKEDLVCPVGRTCVPAGDADGIYVRDTANNKIYLSELGWQRYHEGADVDWVGFTRDLIFIVGGSVGGAGNVLAAVAQMLGVAGWGVSFFHDNPPPR